MSIQRKQGFTLIELMVVIVIIGILAAIAIPKLFGMSAKAKAQEIGPAVGTWAKMQIAYSLEKDKLGSFQEIAYKKPVSSAFIYSGSETGSIEKTAQAEWNATSDGKLNDCASGSKWEVTMIYGSDPEVTIAGDAIPNIPAVDGNGDPIMIPDPENPGSQIPQMTPDPDFEAGTCSVLTPTFAKAVAVGGQ